jgi:hypothetical protein
MVRLAQLPRPYCLTRTGPTCGTRVPCPGALPRSVVAPVRVSDTATLLFAPRRVIQGTPSYGPYLKA